MSKSALLAALAAFAVGTSVALKTAPVDTLKSATGQCAIPWYEAWEEGADGLDASRLSEEEIPCCSEMKYCGASLAHEEESLVNVAAVMGFNYAYEGFPTLNKFCT